MCMDTPHFTQDYPRNERQKLSAEPSLSPRKTDSQYHSDTMKVRRTYSVAKCTLGISMIPLIIAHIQTNQAIYM